MKKPEIRHFEKIGSTNDYAINLIITDGKIDSDMAIIADQQTGGRGRLNGRVWESPRGNFYCSYIINLKNLKVPQEKTNSLTLVAVNALQKYLPKLIKSNMIETKQPNDILVKGKKLAGVLTEISYPYAVIGIGINLTNSPIERSTDLQTEFNFLVKPMDLVENLYGFLIEAIAECYFL